MGQIKNPRLCAINDVVIKESGKDFVSLYDSSVFFTSYLSIAELNIA